jgi:A/G-specific adenine glycosylase
VKDPSTDTVAPALLEWAELNGRHDLPWQMDPTPYRVWVSEVMLQQTQVATVLPYYQRFVTRFPDVAELAAAPLDEVLHAWTGLGYYARARNLHRASQLIMQEHEGHVPSDIKTLQKLPGIGRSTAGAILALSQSQRHPILDGNARRVLTRYFGIDGDPGVRATIGRLWTLAEACTPQDKAAAYTQAIMDLGASVCSRSRPGCDSCPLGHSCIAHREGRENELVAPRIRRVRRQRSYYAVVVLTPDDRSFLLEQRPARGFWGGLWSFPMFEKEADASHWLVTNLTGSPAESRYLPPQKHVFTHFDLMLTLVAVHVDSAAQCSGPNYAWYDIQKPGLLGLSKAVTDVLSYVN